MTRPPPDGRAPTRRRAGGLGRSTATTCASSRVASTRTPRTRRGSGCRRACARSRATRGLTPRRVVLSAPRRPRPRGGTRIQRGSSGATAVGSRRCSPRRGRLRRRRERRQRAAPAVPIIITASISTDARLGLAAPFGAGPISAHRLQPDGRLAAASRSRATTRRAGPGVRQQTAPINPRDTAELRGRRAAGPVPGRTSRATASTRGDGEGRAARAERAERGAAAVAPCAAVDDRRMPARWLLPPAALALPGRPPDGAGRRRPRSCSAT